MLVHFQACVCEEYIHCHLIFLSKFKIEPVDISRSSQECRSIPKGPEREQIQMRQETKFTQWQWHSPKLSKVVIQAISSQAENSKGNAMERSTRMVEFTFDQRADILCKENAWGREIERCLVVYPSTHCCGTRLWPEGVSRQHILCCVAAHRCVPKIPLASSISWHP